MLNLNDKYLHKIQLKYRKKIWLQVDDDIKLDII